MSRHADSLAAIKAWRKLNLDLVAVNNMPYGQQVECLKNFEQAVTFCQQLLEQHIKQETTHVSPNLTVSYS